MTWLPLGTVYPWTALVPFYLQNLNSLIKGQAEVGPNEFISCLVTCWFWRDCFDFFSLANLPQNPLVLTSFTVPLVVIFTKFDGQIASEFVNLTDTKDEDKWERAREIAEITFQKVYLPKVLEAKYPPKAYVRLEGENDEDVFLKMGNVGS